jgi:hypothetical protein
MGKEEMLQELEQIIYRGQYPDPTSDRIAPLSERPTWEQEMVRKQAQTILDAGFVKLPYDVEEDWEYCLEIIPMKSGELLNRDAYWGTLADAQRDLRYHLRINKDREKRGDPIHFKYGIVRRMKTVLTGESEVVDKVRELP